VTLRIIYYLSLLLQIGYLEIKSYRASFLSPFPLVVMQQSLVDLHYKNKKDQIKVFAIVGALQYLFKINQPNRCPPRISPVY
jgi:hypothetical protein